VIIHHHMGTDFMFGKDPVLGWVYSRDFGKTWELFNELPHDKLSEFVQITPSRPNTHRLSEELSKELLRRKKEIAKNAVIQSSDEHAQAEERAKTAREAAARATVESERLKYYSTFLAEVVDKIDPNGIIDLGYAKIRNTAKGWLVEKVGNASAETGEEIFKAEVGTYPHIEQAVKRIISIWH